MCMLNCSGTEAQIKEISALNKQTPLIISYRGVTRKIFHTVHVVNLCFKTSIHCAPASLTFTRLDLYFGSFSRLDHLFNLMVPQMTGSSSSLAGESAYSLVTHLDGVARVLRRVHSLTGLREVLTALLCGFFRASSACGMRCTSCCSGYTGTVSHLCGFSRGSPTSDGGRTFCHNSYRDVASLWYALSHVSSRSHCRQIFCHKGCTGRVSRPCGFARGPSPLQRQRTSEDSTYTGKAFLRCVVFRALLTSLPQQSFYHKNYTGMVSPLYVSFRDSSTLRGRRTSCCSTCMDRASLQYALSRAFLGINHL